MQENLIFWIWLSEQLGPQSRDFRHLVMIYGNAYDLFHMDDEEIERLEDVTVRTKRVLMQKDLGRASQILRQCEQKGIGILPFDHPSYPMTLREIERPPIVLYYRGKLPNFNERLCIGMVGTRNMSRYGLYTAYKLSHELTGAGVLVVSGMATGIDGVAAASAMIAGGSTVAVLGCGVDVLYPKHHEKLWEAIAENGVLLSEYPPKTRPNQYQFPARNRIISGISRGTVVVEAGLRSGSLITARTALTQGRQVYAVPANVGSAMALGTNGLLRDGALMVLETEDVLRNYRALYRDVINDDGLAEAKKHSRADLHALERYGVIEVVPTTEETQTEKAPSEDAQYRGVQTRAKKLVQQRDAIDTAPSCEVKNEEKPASRTIPEDLDPVQLAVLQAMPDDRPVTVDSLVGLEYPYGEILAAVTVLEIRGLIRKLPGALYTKA